jgi:hypothetical protein
LLVATKDTELSDVEEQVAPGPVEGASARQNYGKPDTEAYAC